MYKSSQSALQPKPVENAFDTGRLLKVLWKHKRLFAFLLIPTVILSIVYSLGVQDTYVCTIKLSPEMNAQYNRIVQKRLFNRVRENTAILPDVYSTLMNSVEFRTSLFDVPVKRMGSDTEVLYSEYLAYHQDLPWWGEARLALFGYIKGLFVKDVESEKSKSSEKKQIDTFRLTEGEATISEIIGNNIFCKVDENSLVLTISVYDQDPQVCAMMADTVKVRLQQAITAYHSNKARSEYDYYCKVCRQAKERYSKALHEYSTFVDANRGAASQTIKSKIQYLGQEVEIQYTAYQQAETDKLSAAARVQESLPAFTTLQTATIPVEKIAPNRSEMVVKYVLIVFLLIMVWVFYKEGELRHAIGFKYIPKLSLK